MSKGDQWIFIPQSSITSGIKVKKSEEIFLVGLGRGLKGKISTNDQKAVRQIKWIFST